MKKLFLIVAMAFITSFASAQISFEQFNQINFKVTPQQMTEQLANYGFDYNYYGNLEGTIDNQLVEVTFTTSQNGMISEMKVVEINNLSDKEYNERYAQLSEKIQGISNISLKREEPYEGKYRIAFIYE